MFCRENAGQTTRACKLSRMEREFKDNKDFKSKEATPKHIFHNSNHTESGASASYYPVYHSINTQDVHLSTVAASFGQARNQWKSTYPAPNFQFYPIPHYNARVASAAPQEQQLSSQPQQPAPKPKTQPKIQNVNHIQPTLGHIYAITGGLNQEHESKRARRDYQQRVFNVSPRALLGRPIW